MIDYPGEILRRFGRYQAVEAIGHAGFTDLWRAWDPHLERFVVVAVLQNEYAAGIYTRTTDLGEILAHWTGGEYRRASLVLDLDLGGEGAKPFLVLKADEDGQRQGRLHADSTASRLQALSRHWDLLAAAGGMLSAAALAWVIRGVFVAPAGLPVARPATPVVIAADEQRRPAGDTAPTAVQRIAPRPTLATVLPPMTPIPAALAANQLVERWLVRHCKGVEGRYEEQGREHWLCSWHDLRISGALPTLHVEFTRTDRAVGDGPGASLEKSVRERYRLRCGADRCRRLSAAPGTEVEVAAAQAVAATPTQTNVERRNLPPVVEILAAPQRVAPGERVVLKARVIDPDSSPGDQVECAWSVDGRPVARLCWEFVWTVPATRSYGNVLFALKARDRLGASDSKSVSVFIGPSERTAVRPQGAPATLPASPTPARAR